MKLKEDLDGYGWLTQPELKDDWVENNSNG